MTSYQSFAFCALVVMCALVGEGSAIHCYECNSHNDSRCMLSKLPDSLKKDCSEHPNHQYVMCRKITQIIEFEVNGMPPDNRVIRGCGWDDSNYKGRCYQRSGFGGRQEVCSCLEDNCNTGATQVAALSLLLGAVGLSRLC